MTKDPYRFCSQTNALHEYSENEFGHGRYIFVCSIPPRIKTEAAAIAYYERIPQE